MADVINRTSVAFLKSVHTPDFPVADWIINPDLSAVAGVPEKYWKVDGDNVVEMKQPEKAVVDAADLVTEKANRHIQIDAKTRNLIERGASHAGKVFSLSSDAQRNWTALWTAAEFDKIDSGSRLSYPLGVSTKDGGEHRLADGDEMIALGLAALATSKAHYDNGRSLRLRITNAATRAAVDAIKDNR